MLVMLYSIRQKTHCGEGCQLRVMDDLKMLSMLCSFFFLKCNGDLDGSLGRVKFSWRYQDQMHTSKRACVTLLPVKVCRLPSLPRNLCSNVIVSRCVSSDRSNSRSVSPVNVEMTPGLLIRPWSPRPTWRGARSIKRWLGSSACNDIRSGGLNSLFVLNWRLEDT